MTARIFPKPWRRWIVVRPRRTIRGHVQLPDLGAFEIVNMIGAVQIVRYPRTIQYRPVIEYAAVAVNRIRSVPRGTVG